MKKILRELLIKKANVREKKMLMGYLVGLIN